MLHDYSSANKIKNIYIKYIAFIQEYGIKVNKIITLRYVKYGKLPGKMDIKKTVLPAFISNSKYSQII